MVAIEQSVGNSQAAPDCPSICKECLLSEEGSVKNM